jgi:hypothetical protein
MGENLFAHSLGASAQLQELVKPTGRSPFRRKLMPQLLWGYALSAILSHVCRLLRELFFPLLCLNTTRVYFPGLRRQEQRRDEVIEAVLATDVANRTSTGLVNAQRAVG